MKNNKQLSGLVCSIINNNTLVLEQRIDDMEQGVGKRLKEYTASAINTTGAVYQKIMANENEDRNEQAAIEKQLNDLFAFLEAYRQQDIFLQEGMHQLKSLNFFSGLRKHRQEVLSSFAHKYRALMLRNRPELDTVWGTRWNIEHALRLFFNNDNCFVMEYTNEQKTNLLADEFTSDTWLLNGEKITDTTAALTEESCLINMRGIELTGNMQLKTKTPITLTKGLYSLHFFIRGKMLKNEERSGMLELSVGSLLKKKYRCHDQWINIQEFIFIEQAVQAVEISFTGIHSCDIDFACLYPCVPYPSLSILIGNGGLRGKQAMFLAPGKADVKLNTSGAVEQYFEPPYRGTYGKYKFWFPHRDDTDAQAKKERKEKHISFDEEQWGYWSTELATLDIMYLNTLIDALMPVGVKVFELLMSRRGH